MTYSESPPSYNADSPFIPAPAESHRASNKGSSADEAAGKSLEDDSPIPITEMFRIVNSSNLTDCVSRVICELSCDANAYGTQGKAVFSNLVKLQFDENVKVKDARLYREAAAEGRKLAKNDLECERCSIQNGCTTSTFNLVTFLHLLMFGDSTGTSVKPADFDTNAALIVVLLVFSVIFIFLIVTKQFSSPTPTHTHPQNPPVLAVPDFLDDKIRKKHNGILKLFAREYRMKYNHLTLIWFLANLLALFSPSPRPSLTGLFVEFNEQLNLKKKQLKNREVRQQFLSCTKLFEERSSEIEKQRASYKAAAGPKSEFIDYYERQLLELKAKWITKEKEVKRLDKRLKEYRRQDEQVEAAQYDYDLVVIGGGSGGLAASKVSASSQFVDVR